MRIALIATAVAAALTVLLFVLPTDGDDALQWLGYGAAVEKGAAEGKTVLVDVYTDWCGWCKRMDRDVYGNEDVQRYLNEHFVVAKLDAESGTQHAIQGQQASERDIARAYGVTGYLATIFLNAAGETITVLPGYVEKDRFMLVLEYIHEQLYKTQGWEEFVASRGG